MTETDAHDAGPYRGLVPYEADDVRYFRGRKREVEAVFERLFAGRLTIVYGASGVGKSSILRAGVVTRLHDHDLTVPVVVTAWQGNPIENVTNAVDAVVPEASAPTTIGSDDPLEQAEPPLGELGRRLCRAVESSKQYVMVILDQFEELLRDVGRTSESPGIEELFDCIVSLTERDRGVSFVVALRADALADLDILLDRLLDGSIQTYRIESMSGKSAEEAITEPVVQYNKDFGTSIEVEPKLAKDVVGGVSTNPDPTASTFRPGVTDDIDLPFLQIVMSRIWEEERVRSSPPSAGLRAETLKGLGGTDRIVSDHVHRILHELAEPDRRIAAQLLDRLITPTGAKVPYSARDLALMTKLESDDVERVLEVLASGDSRLLRTADSANRVVYELFHDRLSGPIGSWTRREHQEEIRRHRVAYRRKVLAVAIPVVGVLTLVLGLLLASILTDDGPPLARVKEVRIPGEPGQGLDIALLSDGDESAALSIPVGSTKEFKIEIDFHDEIDVVDVQVVPPTDAAALAPEGAYIAETRIEIPVGDARPVGRGAFGQTDTLTLIVRARDVDDSVEIAELKFWRNE